jgi:uncharacterized protein (TIGR00290 family)
MTGVSNSGQPAREALPARGVPVFCSWSGGKDSALALHEAVQHGARPRLMISMMTESGQRSRSHGLSRQILQAQANRLGLPIWFRAANWADYTGTFRAAVAEAAADGLRLGVFGDLDTEAHRDWVDAQCTCAGGAAWLPLWKRDHRRAVADLLRAGFHARIVAVKAGILSPALLGRNLDDDVLEQLVSAGADPAGENGEYHTVATDGPLFNRPLHLSDGQASPRNGMWFLDLSDADTISASSR